MGEQIKKALPSVSISNECGKTSLPELCEAIANAQLLLSNDSSAFHIAAAVQTPVVCVLMGRHYGRFAPYPASASWVKTIYPKAFIEQLNSKQMLANATDFSGVVPIEEISVDEVFQAAKMMIQ
jgi:ADP-heptose:LPS heptosyltransferase